MYRIEQNFGSKKILRNYDFEILAEKLWRIQGLPAFSCFIGNFGEKTWRILAIRQIRQSFLPAKVLFYTVFVYTYVIYLQY